MNEKNEFNDQLIKEIDNVIYFSVRQDHISALDYMEHMKSKYKVEFEEEVESVIRTLDFESAFGKIIRVAVIKGEIFEGMKKYPIDTLEFASELGYGIPNPILGCLIFERAMEEDSLLLFNYLIAVTPQLLDEDGADVYLAFKRGRSKELVLFFDEPIPGLYANKYDGYAFSKI